MIFFSVFHTLPHSLAHRSPFIFISSFFAAEIVCKTLISVSLSPRRSTGRFIDQVHLRLYCMARTCTEARLWHNHGADKITSPLVIVTNWFAKCVSPIVSQMRFCVVCYHIIFINGNHFTWPVAARPLHVSLQQQQQQKQQKSLLVVVDFFFAPCKSEW